MEILFDENEENFMIYGKKMLFLIFILTLNMQIYPMIPDTNVTIVNKSKDPVTVYLHSVPRTCYPAKRTIRFDLPPLGTVAKPVGTTCTYSNADFYHNENHWGSSDIQPRAYVPSADGAAKLWINNSEGGKWGIGITKLNP